MSSIEKNLKKFGVQSNRKLLTRQAIKDFILIGLGVISASFGLESFLLPNNFLDGGVTGISLLINVKTDIPLAYLIVAINIPFIIMGFRQISLLFAVKTTLAIIALAIVISTVEFPIITTDKLLIAVFGGFFLGMGIGLAIRGGSVIDGTEILAISISRRSSMSVGDIILIFNIIIFCVAAYVVDMVTAMYAILTYFAASKTVDFLIHGIEQYLAVMIISDHGEEIRQGIIDNMGRGVTVLAGRGGYGNTGEKGYDRDVLYCVITRLEIQRLKMEVEKVDPKAFIVENAVNDIKGGMIKRRPLH